MVEARELGANGGELQYVEASVMYVLRKHISQISFVENIKNVRIQYGLKDRSEVVTMDSLITFDVEVENIFLCQ